MIFFLLFTVTFGLGFYHFKIPSNENILGLYTLKSLRINYNREDGFQLYVQCNRQVYSSYVLSTKAISKSAGQALRRKSYDIPTNFYPFEIEKKWLEYSGAAVAGIAGASTIRPLLLKEVSSKSQNRILIAFASIATGYGAGAWAATQFDPECSEIDEEFRQHPQKYLRFLHESMLQSVDKFVSELDQNNSPCVQIINNAAIVLCPFLENFFENLFIPTDLHVDFDRRNLTKRIEEMAVAASFDGHEIGAAELEAFFQMFGENFFGEDWRTGKRNIYIMDDLVQRYSQMFTMDLELSYDEGIENHRDSAFLLFIVPLMLLIATVTMHLVMATPVDRNPDNLTSIRGIGPSIEGRLNSIGISRYYQIASWDDEEVEIIEKRINYYGISKQKWAEQAAYLELKKQSTKYGILKVN